MPEPEQRRARGLYESYGVFTSAGIMTNMYEERSGTVLVYFQSIGVRLQNLKTRAAL